MVETDTSELQDSFKCTFCKLTFSYNRSLLRHYREKHQATQGHASQRVKCSYTGCNKTFARDANRIRHEKEQHSDGKKTCEGCGKRVRLNAEHNAPKGKPCTAKFKRKLEDEQLEPTTHSPLDNESDAR